MMQLNVESTTIVLKRFNMLLFVIWKNKAATMGLIIILSLILIAILAPAISPHNPIEINLGNKLLSPSKEYPMGTDHLGRCVLSRILYGAGISLQIGVIVVGITFSIGLALGMISGYYGGVVDGVIMRIVDILLALPSIILVLVIVGVLGPSLFNVMLALSFGGWIGYARIARGSTLSVREKEFIEATRALGTSDGYILLHHVLPNILAPIMVLGTLHLGTTILTAAGLGFLGLGVQPPTPEWGAILNEGRVFLRVAWWLTTFPGLAIMITVLAFNFLGDGLRDALDPRLRQVMMMK